MLRLVNNYIRGWRESVLGGLCKCIQYEVNNHKKEKCKNKLNKLEDNLKIKWIVISKGKK